MKKKKWLGALLNLMVPGMGSFYNRNIRKGVLTYVLFFIVMINLRFISFNFTLFLVGLTLLISYYIYLIISGYRDVSNSVVHEPVKYDKWYIYVLIVLVNWFLKSSTITTLSDKYTPISFSSIPTPAMNPALLEGDMLAYKKTKSIERNDVVIFWYPNDTKTRYIKRCIGLPGDSLQIRKGVVFINNKPLTGVELKFSYLVTTDGSGINNLTLKLNQIPENEYYIVSENTYQFYLTEKNAKKLSNLGFVKKVDMISSTEGEPGEMIFPQSEKFDWNIDYFGTIYIPKKGDKIQLTDKNIDLYLKYIQMENENVERDNSGLRIYGQQTTTYQFKESYYFMMGDNRHNSSDSRYWGLLPQELIIGKAMYLFWGETLDRVGKKVS